MLKKFYKKRILQELPRYFSVGLCESGAMESYMTIFELAEKTKLSISALRRSVQLDEIPFHRFMRRVRFKPSEIEAWIVAGGNKAMTENLISDGPEETGAADGERELFTGQELTESASETERG
jgi:excisionase family DNA binding protein